MRRRCPALDIPPILNIYGGLRGIRTPTPEIEIQCSIQLSYECVRELDGCLPDFAGGPVTIRLLPFRSISRTARWANSGHLTWYSIGDPMQRHEGKLEPQGLALSSRRRCLA